ncbi:sensor histidine kinase [Polaribacter sp. Hel_I_88]|uniref:tetratricopeptide repeat-containing sensor histidine kinase n=1 Tax=Polaribacter sp. Hel_I_88 TaxID=1250006 RepID=UPI000A7A6B40|nr:sensor histidine kinase [Polaribacter sp. Hel_I_88]
MFCSFCYAQNSKLDSAYYYFKKGKQFDFENKHYKAYESYIKSRNFYLKTNNKDSIAKCNINLYYLIKSQNNLNEDAKLYLDDYSKYAEEKSDSLMQLKANNAYAAYFWNQDSISKSSKFYKKSLLLTNREELKQYKASVYLNLAFLYTLQQPDSANYFFKKTVSILDSSDKITMVGFYINYALFLKKQRNFKEALIQLKKAEAIQLDAYQLKYNKIIFENFAHIYKEYGNYKKAFEYFEKFNLAKDSLNNTAQNIAISNLDKKYKNDIEKQELKTKNEKNEKENLQLKIDKEKNRNFLIGALLFILFGGVIALLSHKNSKKKIKLAEKEKELASQKNITFLKEQELSIINAMINGQEKERKRIAEDLHDNLGSVLATLKLHFENLQINREKKKINQEELFNKTEGLIDQAYLKVRSIAHAKNAGVISNQALLMAVQIMAEKISLADKIKIEVIHFGLNERLENSLEITVFRIIQELITNIIKHADAKNATINISLYDKNLNIIIEDDGKGFDINKVDLKNGMGINSIKTRVKHLNGTFSIDATLGKGSSIILDIPV